MMMFCLDDGKVIQPASLLLGTWTKCDKIGCLNKVKVKVWVLVIALLT